MPLLVHSVVRRHLKGSDHFSLCDDAPPGIELAPEERAIGTYTNPPPWEDTRLVFTSAAIWILEGQRSERVALDEIVDHESPEVKELGDGVRVRTKDGFRFMRIGGSHGPYGKYKDYIALVNIVRAVVFARGGTAT